MLFVLDLEEKGFANSSLLYTSVGHRFFGEDAATLPMASRVVTLFFASTLQIPSQSAPSFQSDKLPAIASPH